VQHAGNQRLVGHALFEGFDLDVAQHIGFIGIKFFSSGVSAFFVNDFT
jgi:hypothetical protein